MEINEIGLRIKKRRKELGITQKELGRRISRAEVTVQQYESGIRFPNLEARLLIATALDCEYEDLFDREIHIGSDPLPSDGLREWFKAKGANLPESNHEQTLAPDQNVLTPEEQKELDNYRQYLLWKRNSSQDNDSNT